MTEPYKLRIHFGAPLTAAINDYAQEHHLNVSAAVRTLVAQSLDMTDTCGPYHKTGLESKVNRQANRQVNRQTKALKKILQGLD